MNPRLKEQYRAEIRPALKERLGLANVMQIPAFTKVVVNMGLGDAVADKSVVEGATTDLGIITGQKPKVNRSTKSIANFKLREGMAVGTSVTLRGDRMWEFLDRLIQVVIPRIRDFRGLDPNAFDGRGNYTLGLKDQLIFPEIDYGKVEHARGMNITIVTTAKTDEEARELLRLMGMPFSKNQ